MSTTTITPPPAAGKAAVKRAERSENLKRFLSESKVRLAAREAARLQESARNYFSEWVATDGHGSTGVFPAAGYVVFYAGKISGWMRSLDLDRAQNGRLTHRPGCIAVNVDGPVQLWDAIGGDEQAGAEKWEPRLVA